VSYSIVIHFRTDRRATVLFNFKTRIRCKRLNERRLPIVNLWMATAAEAALPCVAYLLCATSVSSLFIRQTDHEQIKNGDHDACDHDRVKMTALFYGFDQSRCIFRLDHLTRQHFLAKPRQH